MEARHNEEEERTTEGGDSSFNKGEGRRRLQERKRGFEEEGLIEGGNLGEPFLEIPLTLIPDLLNTCDEQ